MSFILFTNPVDMRKSFHGLCQLIESQLDQDPVGKDWFVFLNRRADGMKLLVYYAGHSLLAEMVVDHFADYLPYYRLLFDFEDEAREMTPEARHAFRQEKTRPLLEKFKAWIDEHLTTLCLKHTLRKPINCLANRWDCFARFLESPDIPFDNNASERSVKKGQLNALDASVVAASKLFQNARAEYVEVLLAQREYMEARMKLIDMKRAQLCAIVNAYQALGGGAF